MAEPTGELEGPRSGRNGEPSPPAPRADVRELLAELTRRIRDAQAVVELGAPLPARLRGGSTSWAGRLAIGFLRKLGRGLNRDQRHAAHAVSIALESAGDAVNALHERQEEMRAALEEANRAREKYAEIVSYLVITSAQLREVEERLAALRERVERAPAARAPT
jgi:hypothetical protein